MTRIEDPQRCDSDRKRSEAIVALVARMIEVLETKEKRDSIRDKVDGERNP